MSKVAIVGVGSVGSTTAYSLGLKNIVDEIHLVDINQEYVQGQVEDLQDGFIIAGSKTKVLANNYEQMDDIDIVIITASAPVHRVKDRLDYFKVNKQILTTITKSCLEAGFNGIFIVASNPADVMAQVVKEVSGFKHNRVIGSGTTLDTARFIKELSRSLHVKPEFIDAQSVGEHGKTLVPLYSQVKINGQELDEYLEQNGVIIEHDQITNKVVAAGPAIFNQKGCTEFGIASSLVKIVNAILSDSKEQLLVANYLHVEDIGRMYISTLVTITKDGYVQDVETVMSKFEHDNFITSAKLLETYGHYINE